MTTKQRDRIIALADKHGVPDCICSSCERADSYGLKLIESELRLDGLSMKVEEREIQEADESQCLICRDYY